MRLLRSELERNRSVDRSALGVLLCAVAAAALAWGGACTPGRPWNHVLLPLRPTDQPTLAIAGQDRPPMHIAPADQQPSTRAAAGETPTRAPAGESAGSPQPAAPRLPEEETLGRAEWILSPEALAAADQVQPFTHRRWRHPGLEDLLARGPDRQPDWHAALHSHNPVTRANAAIALAQQGDGSSAEHLAAAVRDPALALPLRCAAAEALGTLPGEAATGLLGELSDQYGRSNGSADSGTAFYLPELHAELIHALAGRATPEDQPRLLQALRSPAAEVRLEALRAWMLQLERSHGLPAPGAHAPAGREDLHAGTRDLPADARHPEPDALELHSELWDLPAEAIDQRSHGDWRVRAAAVRLIGLGSPRRTHEYLKAALQDHDWRVRVAAIESLGLVGDPQAQEMLASLQADRVERIRAAVVDALAAAGRRDKVFEAVGDESWRVRRQVARALAAWPDESSERVAWTLLNDPSAEVQLAVVEAVGQWPLGLAGELLLSAMNRPSLMTRQAAARCLAAQWPEAAGFLPEAPPERRRELIDALRRGLSLRFPALGTAEGANRAATAGESAERSGHAQRPTGTDSHATAGTATEAAVAAVERLLAAGDLMGLSRFGPELVPALERISLELHRPLPEAVYSQVLARTDPVFAALEQLGSGELRERRRAAAQLAHQVEQRPLPRLALERLVQLVAPEPDVLVWQDALTIVGTTGGEGAIRLAYAGLSHPEPEVRRRACELLADRPDPRHLEMLTPALEDRHPAVRLAAIRAWGLSGQATGAEPPPALRRMVAGGSSEQRLAAALALARVGDPAGKPALERLVFEPDPDVRRRVAQVMGELGDPAFAPVLVRMLDDQLSVARAALQSLPKVVGYDAAERKPLPQDTFHRMRRWREWLRSAPARQAARSREGPGQTSLR